MGIRKEINLFRNKNKFAHTIYGFTLIEIMIVIAIICVLLILSYIVLATQLAKGRDSKRKSDIYYIQEAVEEYEKDHDCYPNPLPACNPGDGLQPYLNKIPCDPVTKSDYDYIPDTDRPACPQWYWIFTELENKNDAQIEELGCLNGCGPDFDFNYYQTSPNAPEPPKGDVPATQTPDPTITPLKYYGCFSGDCREIPPDPLCHPNYWNDPSCDDLCINSNGDPQNECEY